MLYAKIKTARGATRAKTIIVFLLLLLLLPFQHAVASASSSSSSSHPKDDSLADVKFAAIARGGQAELLLSATSLSFYLKHEESIKNATCLLDPSSPTATNDHENERDNEKGNRQQLEQDPEPHLQKLLELAQSCRQSYLTTGIAHVPHFVRDEIVIQMVHEAIHLQQQNQSFYSTERHTVYQEPQDTAYDENHPRNALQNSSKWIMDYDRLAATSPLKTLYLSPQVKAFVSYIVRPKEENDNEQLQELFVSGCDYNAAYYNIYHDGDGLGWHFDRSQFGVNLELQLADQGGIFELDFGTRSNVEEWNFDRVQSILSQATTSGNQKDDNHDMQLHRVENVGPGSLVIFAGARNLHRVTPVLKGQRINAIMTYETQPHQRPNAYSLQKFFGRR